MDKQRTWGERIEHVLNWRASGVSQAAYSRGIGIHPTTFGHWVRFADQQVPLDNKRPLDINKHKPLTIVPVVVESTAVTLTHSKRSKQGKPRNVHAQGHACLDKTMSLHGRAGWRLTFEPPQHDGIHGSCNSDWLLKLLSALERSC